VAANAADSVITTFLAIALGAADGDLFLRRNVLSLDRRHIFRSLLFTILGAACSQAQEQEHGTKNA